MKNSESINELRVHGVSGTPPRDMLYTDPVPRLEARGYARIYQQRPSLSRTHPDGREYNTEAFHWGSLTTGHWLTSLWVLLSPFAFANVSGWMAVKRSPLHRSVIRIACLALTALFVAQVGYVVVGVPVDFAMAQDWATDANLKLVRAGVGLSYVLVFGALVLRLSAQSHFEPMTYRRRFSLLFSPNPDAMTPKDRPTDWGDPAASRVGDAVVWDLHSIVHRLRRIHFATGVLVASLTLARMVGNDWLINLALLGLLLAVLVTVLTTYRPQRRLGLLITAWMPLAAELLAGLAVVRLLVADTEVDLVAIHRTSFEVAISLGFAGALCVIAGLPTVGALTFGTLFGGALGVGAGFIAEDLLRVDGTLISQGGAWVAPAALIFVLTVAITALALSFRGPPDWATGASSNTLLTRITKDSRALLAFAAVFGLASGVAAFVQGCLLPGTTCRPDQLAQLSGVDAIVAALLVVLPVILAIRLWGSSRKVAWVALVAAGLIALVSFAQPDILGFQPHTYLQALPLSRTLIFVTPVAAIARSVLGAYRQGASSRKVGVLWDVVSFWPRWFHPLAPPAYGPKVVTVLREHLEKDDVDILAAHSQGSVIAAVATHQAVGGGVGRPRGLLTYGSPVEMLYARLFPDVGIDDLTLELPASLESGWVNLWRADDPIGGKPVSGNVENERAVGSGHSRYELTSTYRSVRDRLA